MTLGELARYLEAELRGDPEARVQSVATLDRAGPGQISFLSNPKYRELLAVTRAEAVIVGPDDCLPGRSLLVTPNPYLAFARAVARLHPHDHPRRGIEVGAHVRPSARVADGVSAMAGVYVDDGAEIGPGTVLYPGVYVGREAKIGRDCVLHANAVIREGCVLGHRVVLQPSAVIGSDGYGYARDGARHTKIPQVGIVVVEDDVEVGAGSTVDRAALGETRVRRGTKIDNLVQLGHNVEVGEDCLIVAQVGIGGSSKIGDRVVLAGQVGVVGHVSLGDGVMVGAQSGIAADLPAGAVVSGSPAVDHGEWLRIQPLLRRLPELRRTVRAMEKRIHKLETAAAAEPGEGEQEKTR